MPPTPRLLVVEDDAELLRMLETLFTGEGYHVRTARDGQRALHLALTEDWDALVLDRGLPLIDGLDVLGKLRAAGIEAPTLILSALGNPADRVDGLDRGAEDYLAKPFDVDELLARVRALLRRHRTAATTIRLPGGAAFDTESRLVRLASSEVVALSEREADLLRELSREPSQVFERETLLRRVFPDAEDIGVVDTYVHYLRRKLGRGCVTTIRGIGYRLGES
ncbi:response regulator transcription factor [Cryobacterium psychrophilum]|uniref:Response regulator transcription factor n=1 Tax=Cryobacterium psychrophilum TaxID=41988 RepID=A0A4Y8KUL0_9MICO|nr:response regulator transcription factor [Cryobacterium psychrophilum]TDW29670.1 DNA-binding response OmpR family regulator [Cryobacterium psychrophilum]TFD81782.1 response regulator transcription factor [Cryobacterium psychrophilum]